MATLTRRQCDKYPENWSDWAPSVSPFVLCSWNNYNGSNTGKRSFFPLSFWTPTNYRHEKDEKLSWEFRSKTPDDVSLTLFPVQNFIPNQLLRGRKAALEKQTEEKRRGALCRSVPEDSGVIVWRNKRHKRQIKSILGLLGFFSENIVNGFDSALTKNKAAKPGSALPNDGEG